MCDERKSVLKRLSLMVRRFFAVERKKKLFLLGCAAFVSFWFLWQVIIEGKPPTSAVGCKSRLAEYLWPKANQRKEVLSSLGNDVFALEDEYFTQIRMATFQCHHQMLLGPEEDGGWQVCVYGDYDIRKPCLVYSFGIGHDFRFELEMEKKFGCEVHAFDPSMGVPSHQYSEKGFFHDIGIDNIDGNAFHGKWTMKRLKSIIILLGHEKRAIDYLKMDVEFSEWLALQDIIDSGLIPKIRQMAVEFHTPEMDIHDQYEHRCTWSTRDTLAAMLRILLDLKNSGMQYFHERTNFYTQFKSGLTGQHRYCCNNAHFVNNRFDRNQWT